MRLNPNMPLHGVIAAWEGRVAVNESEDLPNRIVGNAFEEEHPVTEGTLECRGSCPYCFPNIVVSDPKRDGILCQIIKNQQQW
jgi:hypothetical protein